MTKAETETTIRWDDEERVLWLGTTSAAVVRAWAKAGIPARVLGLVNGQPRSWEARVPMTRRFPWRALLPRQRRAMTDQERALARERLSSHRESARLMGRGNTKVAPPLDSDSPETADR